jgi:formylglycine-generating enzyme
VCRDVITFRKTALLSRVVGLPTVALVLPAMIALLTGCGGSDSQPKPSGEAAQAQPAAPAEAPDNPPPAEGPAARGRAGSKPAPAVVAQPPGIDPSTDPHDVFEVAATEGTFERVNGSDGPMSADAATAYFPTQGSNSTTFQSTESPEPPERPTPKSAVKTDGTHPAKPAKKPSAKRGASAKSEPATAEETDTNAKKTLPSGFRALPAFGNSTVGWPLRIRCEADGAEMALVTGGAVAVGHDGEPAESSPQITIVLDSFYMDLTEVTLKRYERYRQALNEERGRKVVAEPENASSPPEFPVLGLTLKQAEFYAHWAHKELPTEAEWERAARGEEAFAHPWGNGRAIWSQTRKRDTITAVKLFGTDVSPFGIYDLAGNAREWCSDRYSATAFDDAQKSSHTPLRNWKGARSAQPADFHVVKGNGPGWNAWYRVGMNGNQHHANVGFRCVLRLSEKN